MIPPSDRSARGRAARGRAAHAAGLDAEETAARLAMSRGLTVIERRYKTPHGEIDLIATAPGLVVFVEVSTGPDLRFDVVLVGRDGLARWIENARGFDEF